MDEQSQFLSEHTRDERKVLLRLLISRATNNASIEKVQLFEENNGEHNQVDPSAVTMRRQRLGAILTSPILMPNQNLD